VLLSHCTSACTHHPLPAERHLGSLACWLAVDQMQSTHAPPHAPFLHACLAVCLPAVLFHAQFASSCAQVVPLLERPVGMALYEYRNGQLGPPSMQSGEQQRGKRKTSWGTSIGVVAAELYLQGVCMALPVGEDWFLLHKCVASQSSAW
jgi:hypothetical protein